MAAVAVSMIFFFQIFEFTCFGVFLLKCDDFSSFHCYVRNSNMAHRSSENMFDKKVVLVMLNIENRRDFPNKDHIEAKREKEIIINI